LAGVFKENNDRFGPEEVAKFIDRLSKIFTDSTVLRAMRLFIKLFKS
jgi:hypothetical protein